MQRSNMSRIFDTKEIKACVLKSRDQQKAKKRSSKHLEVVKEQIQKPLIEADETPSVHELEEEE